MVRVSSPAKLRHHGPSYLQNDDGGGSWVGEPGCFKTWLLQVLRGNPLALFEQCQMVVFIADDLGFGCPGFRTS